jgi:hypothetical protein
MKSWEFITEDDNTTYQPPQLAVGDRILKGKFKNSPAEIKGFKKDKHNQPVLKTNKGDVQLFKPRITKLMSESEVIDYMKARDKMLREEIGLEHEYNRNWRRSANAAFRLVEQSLPISQNQFLQKFKSYDEYDQLSVGVGSSVAILNADISGERFDIWGFTTPKTVTKIYYTDDEDAIKQFEFNNDPEDVWPRVENATYGGQYISHSIFLGSKQQAESVLGTLLLSQPDSIEVKVHIMESSK